MLPSSSLSPCPPLLPPDEETSCLSEVLSREHSLGSAQDGILGGIIRMLFGGYLQDGWDGLHVTIYGMTNHLRNKLVDEDDSNVITSDETPAGQEEM